MRICVVGAGAIGGFMGAKLALAGTDVTLIARGPHLAAIRERGLTLINADGSEVIARGATATDDLTSAGPHDVVILALKAHQIGPVAPSIPALFQTNTVVLTLQNGIPWWYFQKHGGPFDGRRLESLDPDGTIETHIPPDRVIASIAYPATDKPAPGVIRQVEGNRFPVAELDDAKTDRVQALAKLFTSAGFKSKVTSGIRSHLWVKAWGNLSFNPISALTGATLVDICQFPETRALSTAMMEEAMTIAHRLGITFRHTIEQRIAGAEKVGAHKTSMLQDVEAGRRVELEALVGVMTELGRLTETPTPSIDAVYAVMKLMERVRHGA